MRCGQTHLLSPGASPPSGRVKRELSSPGKCRTGAGSDCFHEQSGCSRLPLFHPYGIWQKGGGYAPQAELQRASAVCWGDWGDWDGGSSHQAEPGVGLERALGAAATSPHHVPRASSQQL